MCDLLDFEARAAVRTISSSPVSLNWWTDSLRGKILEFSFKQEIDYPYTLYLVKILNKEFEVREALTRRNGNS
jgi:hypothetical protein